MIVVVGGKGCSFSQEKAGTKKKMKARENKCKNRKSKEEENKREKKKKIIYKKSIMMCQPNPTDSVIITLLTNIKALKWITRMIPHPAHSVP
jgi:hypothetical protein